MATATWPKTLQQAVLYFADPDRALKAAIDLRWQGKPVSCPTCGSKDVHFIATRRIWRCKGQKHTQQQFSVKVGTIMEDSPLGLDKWLVAIWLITNAKNGISSYELHRALGITQKTAWFLLHRIRLAHQDDVTGGKLGGEVEVDETFIGGKARNMHKSKLRRLGLTQHQSMVGKTAVMGLLERNTMDRMSRVRMAIIPNTRKHHLRGTIDQNVTPGTTVYSDSLPSYKNLHADDTYVHQVIDHAECYVKGNIHTNGMENFWSLLKRTIKGTYVSIEPFHLFRYLDEQGFRFNNREMTDSQRFVAVGQAIVGRRVTYKALTGYDMPESPTF
jgi:transposase-like protein